MSAKEVESKATLVTALYNHTPKEILGGRGWVFDFYAAPFKNVLNLELPIKIYSHEKMIKPLEQFMKRHSKADYDIEEYDLHQFKYSDQILELRRASGKFENDRLKKNISDLENDRNFHLCLLKIFWLRNVARQNLFNSKNFFWIDAGLFHHGIFPEKYGGRERLSMQENDPKLYYPQHKQSIFSPTISHFLSSKVEKFLCMRHQEMPIDSNVMSAVKPMNKILGYIVGGLFGGPTDYIEKVCSDFDDGLKKVLEKKVLTLEENLLSCISGNNRDLYQCYDFFQWHHDIKGEPCYYGANPKYKSFYKIFKDDFR